MESHRRLPHRYPPDRRLFLTWHLHGSLPHSQSPPPAKVSAGQVFVWIDRYLDRSQHGPQFLRQEAVAKLVIAALLSGARLGHFRLKAGLVSRAQDYLWSSAHEEWREGVDRSVDAARVGACATTPRRAEPLG